MRAARFYAPGDVRVEDVPRPEPGDGDVLVRVEVALTDGTDLKAFRRGHPVLLGEPPAPFGHEFCGFTEEGGRIVAANSDGDRADLQLLNGAYAEWLVVPERIARVNLLPVPDRLAPEIAAMVEPLACCLHGVERAGMRPEDTVAVLGTGAIGLMLCACIADAGARPVAVGRRSELAREFGAEPGDGRGADVVIEAAGTEQAWLDALDLVRPGGTVLFFGGLERGASVPVDAFRLHYEELTLLGAFHHTPATVRAALVFLASGGYPWERLITHRISLDELPELLRNPPAGLLKAAVYP
ncbi:MAG TPA: zinc-binding dehydrogenase [Gaiellaceae bacterium]